MSKSVFIDKVSFNNFSFSSKLKAKETTTLRVNVDTSFSLPEADSMKSGMIKFDVKIIPLDNTDLFHLSCCAAFIMFWDDPVNFEEAKKIMSDFALPIAYSNLSERLKEIMLNLALSPIELPQESLK